MATGPRRLADHLQNAAIPALNRIGHAPVGAFEVVTGVPSPTVFLLVPLPTLASLGEIEPKLRADQDYVRAAAPYIDATAADPVYVREETSLLTAFPAFPNSSCRRRPRPKARGCSSCGRTRARPRKRTWRR